MDSVENIDVSYPHWELKPGNASLYLLKYPGIYCGGALDSVVVKTLCYTSEGRRFETR